MPAEKTVTAEDLAKGQREISISEFFVKNKHLLGFDNPRKALLTTIKEACDNSLDACEEARIVPEIKVEIKPISEDRFIVIVEDNGPGIVKEQIPRIFAKLLYGSKFHRFKQSVTGDEPIILRRNGKIQIVPIERLINKYLKEEGETASENMQVPCFNWKTYKYSFQPISHLIKHKRENEIYEITAAYGKAIKVTGCHSLFTIDKKTLKIKEAEARNFTIGDVILAPKKIEIKEETEEINLLDYITETKVKKQYWYLYTKKETIKKIFENAKIIHKKTDKPRKYCQLTSGKRKVDIRDDSYKQYITKGFIPVWLAKFLGVEIRGEIRTYYHGKEHNIATHWPMTEGLARMLGLFVAEGHSDKRQIGFTFSREERELIQIVCETAYTLGIGYTIEERPEKNSTRVKLFGGVISHLFRLWCGHSAKNKKIPEFIFTARENIRQEFLDYLYIGDGHKPPEKNILVLSTTSQRLANETCYLWLSLGITAGVSKSLNKGYRKTASMIYAVRIGGKSLDKSNYYQAKENAKKAMYEHSITSLAELLGKKITYEMVQYYSTLNTLTQETTRTKLAKAFSTDKIGYKIRILEEKNLIQKSKKGVYSITKHAKNTIQELKEIERLLNSDFIFLKIRKIKKIKEGHEYVYDISVPEGENFVAGFGGLACHNSRGQQGIGVSASCMYGQLTTGKPAKITSKTNPKKLAHYFELIIDTKTNEPKIVQEHDLDWPEKKTGIKVEIELIAKYQKGNQSVDQYLKQTAIVNPHLSLTYINPEGEKAEFPRATNELPKEPKEIKPHPHGIELGILIKMLHDTEAKTLQSFLQNDFCRISSKVAKEVCEKSSLDCGARPERIAMQEAEILYKSLNATKIISPPTDCVTPIGEELIIKGLKKEVEAEFYTAVSRPPSVYRGNPFVVEAGLAFGGSIPGDDLAKIYRFANRVPLLYQLSACATTKAVVSTTWRNYGLSQSKGALPAGPVVILIHIASVWVPSRSCILIKCTIW
ncbi:DNA topoisomerase VI subunit B [Candidatus Woesearchaeota archaeon]|nr:DNA topoisomerase VI subunit B [Candidatus Woesearchaeota archaeon]